MDARKKKGIGFIVSGVATALVGAVLVTTTATPEWVTLALTIAGSVGSVLGFTFVFPDTTETE